MPLRRTTHGYEIDLKALLDSRVGSSASDQFAVEVASHYQEASEADDSLSLAAHSKGAFVDGLHQIWGRSSIALLAPNSRHLQNSKDTSKSHDQPEHLDEHTSTAPERPLLVQNECTLVKVLTSGSSGEAQIHKKSARQILGEALALGELLQLTKKDTVLATTDFHHIYGLLFGVLAPWAAGSRIVTDEANETGAFHPKRIAALARTLDATHLVTVPAHLRALTQARPDLGAVRRVICSAAPLDPADARRFEDTMGIKVTDVLGSTETGGIATRCPANSKSWQPLQGVKVSIGEGDCLMLNSPFAQNDQSRMITGERARLHSDGSFEYLGRSDGVVKVGGKRLHLAEIEGRARRLPEVKDALALSRSVSTLRGQEILLVIEGKGLTPSGVKAALRGDLDPSFVPRRVRIVEQMPRDERGKVSRNAALALFNLEEEAGLS